EDTLDDLLARFGRWHDPIPALLRATRPESLLLHDIRYLATPLPTFYRGRAVLLDDAAHAMTPDLGQGGCQALEHAVELCAALERIGDIPTALAAYDGARLARTRRIMRASRRMGRVAQARNPIAAAVRNALVALTPPSAMLRGSAGVLGWTPPRVAEEPSGTPRGTEATPGAS